MPSRTSISTRTFRCTSEQCSGWIHSRRERIETGWVANAQGESSYAQLYPSGESLSTLRCATCNGPMRVYNVRGAGVHKSERTIAWVSPEGTRVANLAEPNGIGPQGRMYARAGWERVECDTLQKLERVNAIRTAQKSAEAGYPVTSRFDVADYDAGTLRAENDTLAGIEHGPSDTANPFIDDTLKVPDIFPTS